MTYTSLMVHLLPGESNASVLKITADLARRFQARVIGIGACRLIQPLYNDVYVPSELIDEERDRIEKELLAAKAELYNALAGNAGGVEWRSAIPYGLLSDYVLQEARCADLLITGLDPKLSGLDGARHVSAGDLALQAGRPLLVVPAGIDKLALDHVVIGWKDTRETRRAVADALPFLKSAAKVTVIEIAPKEGLDSAHARLKDVAGWLRRHGIEAEPLARPAIGDDAKQLGKFAQETKTDLLVAGAYGHSRLREWIFGGVTQDLLLAPGGCALVSH